MEYKVYQDKVLVHVSSEVLDGWVECNDTDTLKTYAEGNAAPDEVGVHMKEVKKIPAKLMERVLGTCEAYPHMEIGFIIYRNIQTGDWDIRVPDQTGAGATVSFFEEKHPDPKFQVTGSIHTHPEMGAFWSGTDMTTHTKTPGMVHWVFGLRNGHVSQHKCSYFHDDGTGKSTVYDFDLLTMLEEEPDWNKHREPDPEWKKIIDKQAYRKPVIQRTEKPETSRGARYWTSWNDWELDNDGWGYPFLRDDVRKGFKDSRQTPVVHPRDDYDEDDALLAELDDILTELAYSGVRPVTLMRHVAECLEGISDDMEEADLADDEELEAKAEKELDELLAGMEKAKEAGDA